MRYGASPFYQSARQEQVNAARDAAAREAVLRDYRAGRLLPTKAAARLAAAGLFRAEIDAVIGRA